MKIVRKISDNTVYFLEEDTTPITLGSNLTVGRSVVPTFSSSEYEIIEAVDAPGDWLSGGVLAYDTAWSVVDQSAFDAVIAARATADAEAAAAAVPQAVTQRQARLALLAAGKLDDVDLAISAISVANDRKAAQVEWEYGSEIRRDSHLVSALAPALNLTEEQLDDLFIEANKITD